MDSTSQPCIKPVARSNRQGDWKDLELLHQVENVVGDANFRAAYQQIKQQNKAALAKEIEQTLGFTINQNAIFDVQIKRFHEYKRQHLNLLNIATYQWLR